MPRILQESPIAGTQSNLSSNNSTSIQQPTSNLLYAYTGLQLTLFLLQSILKFDIWCPYL